MSYCNIEFTGGIDNKLHSYGGHWTREVVINNIDNWRDDPNHGSPTSYYLSGGSRKATANYFG
jgi:hypothetical protein|eukprot:scaffold13832_cov228-Alexandrium_tamarense.AAC.3